MKIITLVALRFWILENDDATQEKVGFFSEISTSTVTLSREINF